jgi:cytoskeletal protein CcmA (bactofilin family)
MSILGRGSRSESTSGSSVECLIGQATLIEGNVRYSGGLHVEGRIIGDIVAEDGDTAMLSIGETGSVEGNIHVANLVVHGAVHGDVTATGKITVSARARISGNVRYRIIELESGAEINGQLLRDVPAAAADRNVVAGSFAEA